MYSSLELFKQYIGVSSEDTTNDDIYTMMLNTAYNTINSICRVDTFLLNSYEGEIIEGRGIYTNRIYVYFNLKNKPVVSIDKLNGETYDGVKGADYMILYGRRACFKKLPTPDDFGIISVDYTAGYSSDNIPDELKQAELMLASGLWQKHNHEGVNSYRLGDEQIVFGASNDEDADTKYFRFTNLLNQFRSINLPL